MYKIKISSEAIGNETLDMPNDHGLHLIEACLRADIYKKKNPKAEFTVVSEENGDIEYVI